MTLLVIGSVLAFFLILPCAVVVVIGSNLIDRMDSEREE